MQSADVSVPALFVPLILLVLLPVLAGPQSCVGADTGNVDEGRFLVRGKPILVYPPTAPTRHQLIVGIGVPVQNLPHSVVFGWVLKAQYFLPSLPKDYEPVNVENWNDSRRAMPERIRRGTVERYEMDNVSIRVEPLPVGEETPGKAYGELEEEDDDDEYQEEAYLPGLKNMWAQEGDSTTPPTQGPTPSSPSPPPASASSSEGSASSAAGSRWSVYKSIELLSDAYGFGGRVCVLRSICEAAEAQFTHTGGVFAELLHVMFSPSTTNEPVSEHRDNEYYRAEQLGRSGAPCADVFRECSTSLLDTFSGVHDLHAGASPDGFF